MAARLDEDEEIEASIGEELETLRAIYMSDVEIEFFEDLPSRPRLLTYVVEPATAHDKANRFVSFTLQLVLKENYPYSSAEIHVKNPRGLSESLVERIYASLRGQVRCDYPSVLSVCLCLSIAERIYARPKFFGKVDPDTIVLFVHLSVCLSVCRSDSASVHWNRNLSI